jgi:AraC-like DNA-binding protein
MENFIIVSAIVHAYVFAILFFMKKQISSRILGLYMLSFFVQSFLFANFHIFKIHALTPYFYLLITSISLIDFPLIFLYVKMISEVNYKWSRVYLLHFFPALLIFILQFAAYFSLSPNLQELLYFPKEVTYFEPNLSKFFSVYGISITILLGQVFVYTVLMIRKLIIHKRNIEKYYSYKEHISLNWLLGFVILYLSYYLFEVIIFTFRIIEVTEVAYFSMVSLHIFIIGIWGLKQREIYGKVSIDNTIISKFPFLIKIKKSETPMPEKIEQDSSDISNDDKEIENIDTDKRQTLLSPKMRDDLADKIRVMMEINKLFLNPELSLEELASELNVHKNYVSFVVNEVFNKNFYNFINSYRINEARKMLSDPEFNHLSIEGIAKSCGYKSRNVFYPLFKKETGQTPLEFKTKSQAKS